MKYRSWLSGSLTCSASVIGSLDATCHTGATRVSEPQNHTEQMLAAVFWVNMHSYSDLTLQGTRVIRVWAHDDVIVWERKVITVYEDSSTQRWLMIRQQAEAKERKTQPKEMRALHLQSQQEWKPASSTTKILALTRAFPLLRGVE